MKTYNCPKCGGNMARGAKHCMRCYRATPKTPMAESSKRLLSVTRRGPGNPMWKQESVSYRALHQWVRQNKPKPAVCEACKHEPPRDVANISGNYMRDIHDYEYLCRSCHMRKDGRAHAAVRRLNNGRCELRPQRDMSAIRVKRKWAAARINKPDKCEHCGERPALRLISLSGDYKQDVSDYAFLCVGCHLRHVGVLPTRENREGERCISK